MVKTALLLTQPSDMHAPPVAEEVRRRGIEVIMCDLADFPKKVTLQANLSEPAASGWNGCITVGDRSVALDQIQAIWWRRPQRYRAPEGYTPGEREFIEQEAYRGLVGVLESLEFVGDALWVSRPQAIRKAELKPLQLALARSLGLRTPKTLVTNDPDAVRGFYEECEGQLILKAVSKGIIEGTPTRFLYTSEVSESSLSHLDGIRATAHLLQERIPKAVELRVVIIGRQVFVAEIYSQSSDLTRLDWRKFYPHLSYGVHTLPMVLQEQLCKLVRAFGLQFASMDLILTPAGEYVWLELNGNGQWFWLQLHLGDRLPLKEAMADLLVYPEEYRL